MERVDLPRVREIARASLPEAWASEGFAGELVASSSVCLVIGEPIVGYAIGSVVAGELDVRSIAVDAAARRSGAGKLLLSALIDRARDRGATNAFLEVRADNAAAIALYVRAGFARSGVRARYYTDGTDAWLMASALAT